MTIGVSPLPVPRSSDVAQSPEAAAAARFWVTHPGSQPYGTRATQFAGDLAAALSEAVEAGWDGYGGRPVSRTTIDRAISFINLSPASVPAPTVSVDPDGEIAFEWYRGPRLVFSVSVGDRNELAYAGLFGASRAFGTEFFIDELPGPVLENLRRLYGD